MEYYNVKFSTTSQDMTTLVTEFGRFRYNCLPMRICASGDTFQEKVDKLLGDIEEVKTSTDNILVLRKESLPNHTEEIIIILVRLITAGVKVNAPKCVCVWSGLQAAQAYLL